MVRNRYAYLEQEPVRNSYILAQQSADAGCNSGQGLMDGFLEASLSKLNKPRALVQTTLRNIAPDCPTNHCSRGDIE